MKTIVTGWVIIYPNGRVNMNYFTYPYFTEAFWPNTSARQQEIMKALLKWFPPGCRAVRTRVVPFEEAA